MRAATTLLAASALSIAVAGCSTAGTPSDPQPAGSTTAASATSTDDAVDLDRARTFDLVSADPCELLTVAQRAQLALDQPPQAGGDAASDPSCVFLASAGVSYGVFIDLAASAGDTVAAIQEKISSTATIDGFEVPLAINPGQSCSSFVNTGDGQYLSVQANGLGEVSDDELCQLVQPATQMVLENLTALQP